MNSPPSPSLEEKAQAFLKDKDLYQLGQLLTEQGHPLTTELSTLAMGDLPWAVSTLLQVDIEALSALASYTENWTRLAYAVQKTLNQGGNIYLGGCGATGRLSLSLERLWRQMHPGQGDRVRGFIAGGDVALVHAIEGFEDFPEYGARQLMELGFKANDLFIGITEGGETPFVIGATEKAAEVSSQSAFFLHCNPQEILEKKVERSRRVFHHSKINSMAFVVGPMALAGSTRMQASTALMLAVGLCLLADPTQKVSAKGSFVQPLEELQNHLLKVDNQVLCRFIESEADCYQGGHRTVYVADEYAMSVFTDTTERAPTFSLAAFDNSLHPQSVHSLSYVSIPGTQSAREAWQHLYLRAPRTLRWSQDFYKTTESYMQGFDFSERAIEFREHLIPDGKHFRFNIEGGKEGLTWSFRNELACLPEKLHSALLINVYLKMLLNIHSTLVMGRLGRYESHFMTYVAPSNGKLVDRATRYVRQILKHRGVSSPEYDVVAKEIFRLQAEKSVDESVVLKAVEFFQNSIA